MNSSRCVPPMDLETRSCGSRPVCAKLSLERGRASQREGCGTVTGRRAAREDRHEPCASVFLRCCSSHRRVLAGGVSHEGQGPCIAGIAAKILPVSVRKLNAGGVGLARRVTLGWNTWPRAARPRACQGATWSRWPQRIWGAPQVSGRAGATRSEWKAPLAGRPKGA